MLRKCVAKAWPLFWRNVRQILNAIQRLVMPLTPAEWFDMSASFRAKELSELEALDSPPPLYSDLENSDEERMLLPSAQYIGSNICYSAPPLPPLVLILLTADITMYFSTGHCEWASASCPPTPNPEIEDGDDSDGDFTPRSPTPDPEIEDGNDNDDDFTPRCVLHRTMNEQQIAVQKTTGVVTEAEWLSCLSCLSPHLGKRGRPPRYPCSNASLDRPVCKFNWPCLCISCAGCNATPNTTPCLVCGVLIPYSICIKNQVKNVKNGVDVISNCLPFLCFACKSVV